MPTGLFASGSSLNPAAVVPASAAVGEQALLVIATRANSPIVGGPSGWTPLGTDRASTSSSGAAIGGFTKTVTSGDIGASVSSTLGAVGPWCAVVVTVPNLHALHPTLRSKTNIPLPAPQPLGVTVVGTAGTTRYEYVCTAVNEAGESLSSAVLATTRGPAVLSSSSYAQVRFNPVIGANTYNVYGRTSGGPYTLLGSCDNTNVGSGSSDQRRGIDDIGQSPGVSVPPTSGTLRVHWDGGDADIPGKLTTTFANARVLHAAAINAVTADASLALTSVPSAFTLLGQTRQSSNRILLAVALEDLTTAGDLLSGRLGDFNVPASWTTISTILRPVAANGAPVAIAGIDYVGFTGSPVYLDASLSYDLDEDNLTYSWTQVSGTAVTLTNPTTVSPSYTAPSVEGLQVFRVTVTDPDGLTATDDVTIAIADPSHGAGSTPPAPPAFKSVTTATSGSGTAPAIVLPNTGNGAATGDYAILVLSATPGTATDPAGWTPLLGSPTTATGSSGRIYVWTKILQAGDLGATLTLTLGSSSRAVMACITTDSAIVDTSAIDLTNTVGTVVTAPSLTPSTPASLLVSIFGTVPNVGGDQPTWTPDPATTERADLVSTSGSSHNATLLVTTQNVTSGAATGTRVATPSLVVQRQAISLILITPILTIHRQSTITGSRPFAATKTSALGQTGAVSNVRGLSFTKRLIVARLEIMSRARSIPRYSRYSRYRADWHDGISGGTPVLKEFLEQIEDTFVIHDTELHQIQATGTVAKITDGLPTDADFEVVPVDGTLAVNSVTGALYIRLIGIWRIV